MLIYHGYPYYTRFGRRRDIEFQHMLCIDCKIGLTTEIYAGRITALPDKDHRNNTCSMLDAVIFIDSLFCMVLFICHLSCFPNTEFHIARTFVFSVISNNTRT